MIEKSKNQISFGSDIISTHDLIAICYNKIAPNDLKLHYDRIGLKNLLLEMPKILGKASRGIEFTDIFCGAGGLSLGFELEGAKSRFALDHDPSAVETYAINRTSETRVLCGDVKQFLEQASNINKSALLIGGPPCQGFSNANQQPTLNDPRNILYKSFLEAAVCCKAEVLVFENVPGILKKWAEISDDLHRFGYSCSKYEVEASVFGAPQKRKRVFIVGLRNKSKSENHFFKFIEERINELQLSSPKTCLGDALYGLPRLEAKDINNATSLENNRFGYTISAGTKQTNSYINSLNNNSKTEFIFNHRTKFNNSRDINLFRCLKPGEDTRSEEFAKINPYKRRDGIFKDKFFRLDPIKPSKTITAHMYYDCHMYIHPFQDRGLTPREAARVQGFPDQYIFLGKPNEWYRQIGNAVSPIAARNVAKAVLDAMETLL